MGDKTIIKVDSAHSPSGPSGQMYLATGVGVGMRLWRDRPPGEARPRLGTESRRYCAPASSMLFHCV